MSKIDIDQLSDSQLAQLYVALQNAITNNAYNGSYHFYSKYKDQVNAPKMQELYEKNARSINSWEAGIANVSSLMRAMVGTSRAAAAIRRLNGMSDIFNKTARVKKEVEEVASYIKDFIGDKFNTINENSFLTMYATLLTVGNENFTDYKQALREDIDNNLRSKDKDTKKSAKIIKEVFDTKIADARTIKDIKITAKEKQIINYFVSKFKSKKQDFKEVSEVVYNIEFKEGGEVYLPLLVRLRDFKKADEITNSAFYQGKNVRPKKDGSLNERTYSFDPKKQTFDYDFINAAVTKYGAQLSDIETAKHIYDFNATITSPNAETSYNGNQTIISERMQRYVETNNDYFKMTPTQRFIVDVLNVLAKVGTRIKLGGISQFAVQTIPVFARANVVLGRNAGLVWSGVEKGLITERGEANRLFNKYPISLRGYLKQEFSSVNKTIPKATREKWRSALSKSNLKLGENIDKIMMASIEYGDRSMAQATWLAFYMQNLREQGLYDGTQSMKELADNPNDDAAEYAEQMVAETQVPSDVDQNGNLFSNGESITQSLRKIAFPFITFRANQSYAIVNSMQGMTDKKQIAENTKELLGVFTENVTFAGLSTMRFGASVAAASAIASVFGINFDEDNEEEKQQKYSNWINSTIAKSLADMIPFYGYGVFDSFQVRQMNQFYFNYILSNEERDKYINTSAFKNAKTDKEKDLIMERAFTNFSKTKNAPMVDWSKKGGDSFDVYGPFGYPVTLGVDVLNTYDMTDEEVYQYNNKWNAQNDVELSQSERDLLLLSVMMQASNYFLPKEIGDMGRRLKSGVIYKDKGKKKKKGGTLTMLKPPPKVDLRD